MALSSTGITTSLVGNAIGSSSRNVGALCSSSLINEWSKWKPISSNVGTMTLAELKNRNYGIKHTVSQYTRFIGDTDKE